MKTSRRSGQRGFTLVETMIGVTIIGLLASLGVPALSKARLNTIATSLANDYRIYSGAFEMYATEHGHWPDDVNRGVVPDGMEGLLPKFTEPSYMDGRWDWDYRSTKVVAGVTLRGGNLDDTIFARIDEILDDGDLSTGRFISTSSGATYVLEF